MAVLFHSELDDFESWSEVLRRHIPTLDIRPSHAPGDPADIDIALLWTQPTNIGELTRLRAVLSLGAGIDQLKPATLPPSVQLARIVDPALSAVMSDYCLMAVLRHHREIDRFEQDARWAHWSYRLPRPTGQTRIGILGLGHLGSIVASRLAANGFQVTGWSRSRRRIEGVRCATGIQGLEETAAAADILVNLLPLTDDTRDILARPLFDRLPKGACVVNVGRGAHLVEADLIEAIDRGQIRAATLDVFREEPLPPGHPFWQRSEILVTPHVASTTGLETAALQIAENIRRVRSGRPLLNPVDRDRGY